MSKRIDLIDIAKGISIILVAFAHSHLKLKFQFLNHAGHLFRIPLFFFLAGIFFDENKSINDFIIKKSDFILKPYFVISFMLIAVDIVSGVEFNTIVWNIKGIFYGTIETITWQPMWFLTNLWGLYMFSYSVFSITAISKRTNIFKISIVALFFTIGALTIDCFWNIPIMLNGKVHNIPGLPFNLDLVFISSAYFMSGFFLRERIKLFKPKLLIAIIAILLLVFIAKFTNAEVDFAYRVYKNPVVSTIAACSGIYMILSLSFLIEKLSEINKTLCFIGRGSLFILIFHEFFEGRIYNMLLNYFHVNDLYISILSFIIGSIIMPLIIRFITMKSKLLKPLLFPMQSDKVTSYYK
jgi:fucose 4-O-acetylase-like acetyltransferase